MITRSTRSLTDRSVPPLPDTSAATTALPPVPPTAPVYGPDAGPPSEAGPAYPDPVDGLLHAAAANRPLEDVPLLVTVLSRPPHHAEHAGHMIRAAAESRSVEEVTRLMALPAPNCSPRASR